MNADMLPALAMDLFDKLNAVPAIVGKVGLAMGGGKADPMLATQPLPLAWPLFKGMYPTDPASAQNPTKQSMQCSFAVFVLVEYSGQQSRLMDSYRTLMQCVEAVRGTTAPSATKWKFEGMDWRQVNPDRLYFELRFSINTHI